MLDIKRIRQNPDEISALLQKRGCVFEADRFLKPDNQKREILALSEEKKNQRNAVSKQIGIARKSGADETAISKLTEDTRKIGEEIEKLDKELERIELAMQNILLALPNLPHSDSLIEQSTELCSCGTPRAFVWEPKTHQEIGSDLHIVDWSGSALTAPVYYGSGARLKRALVCFLMDQLSKSGLNEVLSSGWKESDSLLAMHQNTILDRTSLPLLHSTCTASSVDAAAIVEPDDSDKVYEQLIALSAKMLEQLALPSRTMNVNAEKLAFSAARSCSVEIWMPSLNHYVSVATISDCTDYDARRESIRFRIAKGEKPRLAHTIHGCMMDIAAAIAAILENYQNEDGTVTVPEMLVPYMNTALIR